MLVDGAKYGDVEIPVFCYEPKLGQPVGACRMCLVEVEGIPKLQTACSTAVKDGMVVHTQTERVREAQQAVVEFLLVNHPLDCPVCDKGGECPLQDITYGWGAGTSRFIEPKRHFRKPLELSPLIAIDRERCILCYRCVRFSQDVAEDYQLVLARSAAPTPSSAPSTATPTWRRSAATSSSCARWGRSPRSAYRFRARPWDIEGAGSVCTLCPAQCNVELHRARRARAARAGPRQPRGRRRLAVRQGPLRLPVDPRRRSALTEPMVREGGELRAVSWERALDEAAPRAGQGQGSRGRAGRRRGQQRGGAAAGPPAARRAGLRRTWTRDPAARCPPAWTRALASPALPGHRGRPGVRRTPCWCWTASRSTTPRSSTCASARACAAAACAWPWPPPPVGAGRRRRAGACAARPAAARRSGAGPGRRAGRRRRPGSSWPPRRARTRPRSRPWPTLLSGAGEHVVVLWGEGLCTGPRGAQAARALLSLAVTRWSWTAWTAPGCWRCPRRPTAGACARPVCSPAAARGWWTRRPREWAPPRWPQRWPRASWARCTCWASTRCAPIPTARPGRPRWPPLRSWSPTPPRSARAWPSTPT